MDMGVDDVEWEGPFRDETRDHGEWEKLPEDFDVNGG